MAAHFRQQLHKGDPLTRRPCGMREREREGQQRTSNRETESLHFQRITQGGGGGNHARIPILGSHASKLPIFSKTFFRDEGGCYDRWGPAECLTLAENRKRITSLTRGKYLWMSRKPRLVSRRRQEIPSATLSITAVLFPSREAYARARVRE